MWYNPSGIANLMSFDRLEKLYNILYSTKGTYKALVVYTPGGDVKYKLDTVGLPFVSAKEMTIMTGGICLINTI